MTNAKRRLTDIKFEHEGAHVALVGKHQGGPANGVTTLVYKALDLPEESLQKAAEVTVSLSFHEFLRKFFNMYWTDAEVLAQALGFEAPDDEYDPNKTHKDYIDEKVSAISIIKSVYAASDMQTALDQLGSEEKLAILEAQELLEKAMSSAVPEGDLTITSTEEEVTMETIEKSLHEELLAKAEDVLKAKIGAQEDVIKSLQEQLDVFKSEKAAAVAQERKDVLKASGLSDEEVTEMFAAVGELPEAQFSAVVKQLSAKAALAAESDLFKEAGVSGSGEQDPVTVDQTAEILKAKYRK